MQVSVRVAGLLLRVHQVKFLGSGYDPEGSARQVVLFLLWDGNILSSMNKVCSELVTFTVITIDQLHYSVYFPTQKSADQNI